MVKPFLLLSTREEHDAARGEWEAVVRHAGLSNHEVVQYRLESAPLPRIDLNTYAGVFIGGGPFNASDPVKSDVQLRAEADIARVLGTCARDDIPVLGLCYGVGTVIQSFGGVVDRRYGEDVGLVRITLTDEARTDPLFAGLDPQLDVFVGHKEACSKLPPGAVLLATGQSCPVQAFKVAPTIYATQFHPELDSPGMAARIRIYRDAGYFAPDQVETLVAMTEAAQVSPQAHTLFTRFVELARKR